MVRAHGYGPAAKRGGIRPALAAIMGALLLVAFFAGSVAAHNAIVSCGGFLQLDWKYSTADIIRTSDDPDTLVYDNVKGDGKYAVTPGTYKVVWADNHPYTVSNLVVAACPVPTPTTEPVPTPTTEPVPTPTTEPVPTPTTEPVPTPTTEPVPTPTTPPVATPTTPPVATPTTPPVATPTPKPTPSGTNVAETGTPRITPPPTDGLAADNGSSGPGTGLALVLVLLAGSSLALLPATRRQTRRNR